MATNWHGFQAFGCKTPNPAYPKDIKPKHMLGGCWHGSLMQNGAYHLRSRGGNRKMSGRGKLRFGVGIYKDKIFAPVLLRIKTVTT